MGVKDKYEVVEGMCHPAEADQSLVLKSSYALQRELELQVLTALILKQEFAQHGMTVTDYSALISSNEVVSV